MEQKLIVSPSPHLRSGATTQKIMLDVIIALTPAAIASCILFGVQALILILTCVGSCVLAEYLSRRVMKRDNTIFDLSAVVTGILLAFNLPVTISPLIAIFGSVVAIVVVKTAQAGGGGPASESFGYAAWRTCRLFRGNLRDRFAFRGHLFDRPQGN